MTSAVMHVNKATVHTLLYTYLNLINDKLEAGLIAI